MSTYEKDCQTLRNKGPQIEKLTIKVGNRMAADYFKNGDIREVNKGLQAIAIGNSASAARTVAAGLFPHESETVEVENVQCIQFTGKANKDKMVTLLQPNKDGVIKWRDVIAKNLERAIAKRRGNVAKGKAEPTKEGKARGYARFCVKTGISKVEAIKAVTAAIEAEYLKAVEKAA